MLSGRNAGICSSRTEIQAGGDRTFDGHVDAWLHIVRNHEWGATISLKYVGGSLPRIRDLFIRVYSIQLEIFKYFKQTRKERHLTQQELGRLIGVQKAQISRIESNASNVTIDTLMRVFTAMKAKVKLQIELPNLSIVVGG